MTASATTSEFPAPVPSDFWQPLGVLQDWSPPDHRNARRVERDAMVLISQLEFVASLRSTIAIDDGGPEVPKAMKRPGVKQDDFDEEMLEVLRAMRALHTALIEGPRVRRVKRDVDRFAPHLRTRLHASIEAARDQVVQMRSLAAFLVNEDDDVELGVELVPAVGEPMEPEDSRLPQ